MKGLRGKTPRGESKLFAKGSDFLNALLAIKTARQRVKVGDCSNTMSSEAGRALHELNRDGRMVYKWLVKNSASGRESGAQI